MITHRDIMKQTNTRTHPGKHEQLVMCLVWAEGQETPDLHNSYLCIWHRSRKGWHTLPKSHPLPDNYGHTVNNGCSQHTQCQQGGHYNRKSMKEEISQHPKQVWPSEISLIQSSSGSRRVPVLPCRVWISIRKQEWKKTYKCLLDWVGNHTLHIGSYATAL